MIYTVMILFIFAIVVLKSLAYIYRYQIKEYRLDRFGSMLEEEGIIKSLYRFELRLPAKSIRNLLLFSLVLFTIGFFHYNILPHIDFTILSSIIILLTTPIISLILVSIGVIFTKPLAHIVRNRTVKRAQAILNNYPNLVRIGISGSYGKTSVKEILTHILASEYVTAKTAANMNTDVGVAESILAQVTNHTQYFVAEVGAYRRHEVERACNVFSPQHAIITPFGNQHLSLYGSKKVLVESESEIVPLIPPTGYVIINRDADEYNYLVGITKAKLKSYSLNHTDADIYAKDITTGPTGTTAKVYLKATKGRSYTIKTKLLGEHSIQNILPCMLLAYELGMAMNKVVKAIESLEYIPGKLSLSQAKDGGVILNDTGNSSLHGFLAALEVQSRFPQDKKVVISKGIIELGKEKKKSYNMLIEQLEKSRVLLITTDDSFKKYGLVNNCIIRRNEEGLEKALNDVLDNKTLLLLEGKFTPQFIQKYL